MKKSKSVKSTQSAGPQLPRPPIQLQPQPGNPNPQAQTLAQQSWWKVVLSIGFLSLILVRIFGLAQQGKLWPKLQGVFESKPTFEIIEAHDEIVLMTRQENTLSEVIVKTATENGWRSISQDDFTAKNPALSPKGGLVAYISEKESPHIEIVPLSTAAPYQIYPTTTHTSLSSRELPSLSVCPWSPVQWSPNEELIAFFACTEKPIETYAVVVDISSDSTMVWVEDSSIVADERSVVWLDNTHLLINNLSTDKTNDIIEKVEVQLPPKP